MIGLNSLIEQTLPSCHAVVSDGVCYVDDSAKASINDELLTNKHMFVCMQSSYCVERIESGREWRL